MESGEIFFEHERWGRNLAWSAGMHVAFTLAIFLYAVIARGSGGSNWGAGGGGSAMGVTLVSNVPLPANPVETKSVLATESKGLSQSKPQEKLEEPRIEKLAFHFLLDNLQGVFGGYGTLVRPVAGSKGVIDIGDGHHPCLQRNFRSAEPIWISAAVHLFVVPAGNFRDAPDLLGPWNLLEKIECVNYVRFNLPPFLFIQ